MLGRFFGSRVFPLTCDLHAHLIPGVDDGSKSIEETIEMLHIYQKMGVKKIICTSHIYAGIYNNTEESLRNAFDLMLQQVRDAGCEIELELSAEYFSDESMLEKLKTGRPLLHFGLRYILFEFPFHTLPYYWRDIIFQIQSEGYRPLLAHPERYSFLQQSEEMSNKLIDLGVKFQVNLGSLLGVYGPEAKKTAKTLIDRHQVHALGSDMHRLNQAEILKKSLSLRVLRKISTQSLINTQLMN